MTINITKRAFVIAGSALAVAAVAVVLFLLLSGGSAFSPDDYETIIEGDSEEHLIDTLGDPDRRLSVADALSEGSGIGESDVDALLESSGLEAEQTWQWLHGDQVYILGMNEGHGSSGPEDPRSCDEVEGERALC